LSSPKIAIDDRHTPKLYARFLAGLLSRHRRDGTTVGRSPLVPPPQGHVSEDGNNNTGQSTSASTATSTSMGSFTSSAPENSGQSLDFNQASLGQVPMDTAMYTPEAVGFTNNGASQAFDWTYGVNGFSDEEMLATMQAIKNPTWWSNMMMPGFFWPEGSPSPPAYNMPQDMSFGLYNTTEVVM